MQVTITDDFDLEKIIESGQCFRAAEIQPGLFRFILLSDVLYIRQTDSEHFVVSCDEPKWSGIWKPFFDLDRDYKAVRKLAADPFLRDATEFGKGIRILRQDPWETLISFIISQRKSIPAIRKSIELLSQALGEELVTPYETLHAFPSPAALASAPVSLLQECKLGYRAPYVHATAQRIASGQCSLCEWQGLGDDELMTRLISLQGVGIKVASCVGLFSFGRTGLAPIDTWIRKIIDTDYDGVDPFPKYGPVAGIMQQYAFFYALNHKERYSS